MDPLEDNSEHFHCKPPHLHYLTRMPRLPTQHGIAQGGKAVLISVAKSEEILTSPYSLFPPSHGSDAVLSSPLCYHYQPLFVT